MTLASHDVPIAVAPLPPQRAEDNLFTGDLALVEAIHREAGDAFDAELVAAGAEFASAAAIEDGFEANAHTPEHVAYDRDGRRADRIAFHESHHRTMQRAIVHGINGAPWGDPRPGAHVARAAKFLMLAQVEAGSTCPIAMTYSCVPALRNTPQVAAVWEPLVSSPSYDPRELPAREKTGALIGMALTERGGGSDLRNATQVVATPDGDDWVVTGEKWFVSAVQSDAFFVTTRTANGLSLILVPRLDEDGRPNGMRIDQLKDKLGNRSNPTAEVVFDGARGSLVGEEGRGVRAIMAMIGGTRHDCVLGSTAVMRLGVAEAIQWADHRSAFGATLARQPLMAAVLADLAIESEAATASSLRLSRAIDGAARGDAAEALLRRIAAPILKFWIGKRAPQHAAESLECQGGFGYMLDSRLARAYREAPLMSVWEGSGNVQALDVLRALAREPDCADALFAELELAAGADPRLDAEIAALRGGLDALEEIDARVMAGRLARALQASLLVVHGPSYVADAFCATRLGERGLAGQFGALPTGTDIASILDRARAGA